MSLSNKKIKEILLQHYGIASSQIESLAGYEDVNYLIQTTKKQKYILKISHPDTPKKMIKAQNQLLKHLAKFPKTASLYPQLVPTINESATLLISKNKTKIHLRLLSFLEGTFLAEAFHTKALFYNIGQFVGTTNTQLGAVKINALELRKLEWDLQYLADTTHYLSSIQKPQRRTLVHYFLQQIIQTVQPQLKQVPKSIIHGDINDWNLLVTGNKVAGLIDFGDTSYSHTINELAITIAYAIMNKEQPLEWAAEIVRGYHKKRPLKAIELKVLYWLIAGRWCQTVLISGYHAAQDPDNEYLSISLAPAWTMLEKWITINPLAAENCFRQTCGLSPIPPIKKTAFVQHRHQYLSKSMSISYANQPIRILRAALQYMYDDEGNTYLDGVNNICHVGHCHPKVVAAGQQQMAILNTNTRYLYDSLNEYAEMLCATFPAPLNKVFFVNSGSAAGDLAARLAKAHTKRSHYMVVDHGYHGNTSITIDLSPYKYQGKGGAGQADHIIKVPIPDAFRGPFKYDDPKAGEKYAKTVQEILQEAIKADKAPAGFFCESIIGCGGQIEPPKGYLKKVYQYLRKAGVLCIADEVQTGFGRVGSHFWAFERQDVVPDIVILGKPIGNGHPLAAVVTTDAVAQSFENGMEFFSSFGGNPVSCEIGKAVLQVIKEDQLQENALQVGSFLIEALKDLQEDIPAIGDIRGAGLFLGIEIIKDPVTLEPDPKLTKKITHYMKKKGIFLSIDGPYYNVIKFKPPLCFNIDNAQRMIMELDDFFGQMSDK